MYKYHYYVDSTSKSHISLGTYEYPFKSFENPFFELTNLIYESDTEVTVFYKRGTSYKLHPE